MKTLITNAHVVSPDVEIQGGAVEFEAGKITAIYDDGAELPAADEVIDAGGRYVMPGFIDIHSHGADRADVCDNDLDAVRHMAMKKLQEGVTTLLPTTLTQPQDLLEEIAGTCAQYMENQEFAKVPGLHVEGPFINKANAGAQNPQFVRKPNFEELKRIHDICPVTVFSIAPDVEGACDCIRQAKEIGISSSAAHTSSTSAEIMAAKEAGLTHLTHFGNAMTGLHHREIGVVGTGLLDQDLKIELICDGIHLCPDFLKLVFTVKPIEQLVMITDSMRGSWIDEGIVDLGGLDVVVKDKQARLKDGGALAGSILLYNEGLANIVELTDIPLHQLVKATSWNQAQSLGIDGVGKLEPGFCADIVILDKDFGVWKTLVDGEVK
ncbi:N-acetylglucosamine-6-phosphate deacetylase [Verrucomicrobiaceae bacterium N1E253]|uniref:N-acetylglucosamine-6-phosphate deacetylase n=1 Tax=Oceaniferula marina TaxID=2748318 RepID=A0A851GIP0_9BACT|nr:N-acetylglucosamine-6-phosphate deacetylase [Oceaniferula marina]NWK57049.1 N-acetylglucosamine-6-phosphate deacetylase [Oceaniferula marina]